MSVSIDNRIVQMTFDNKQFEAAVKQSMASLKNLDNTIKDSSSGKKTSSLGKALSKAGQLLNFAELSSSIESIKNRFSTLGIIGMTVLQNLTNSAVDLAKKGLASINNALFIGGWQRAANLEQAQFRLQGILKSADKVKAVMEDVNWAVDGTAYGLDEAASAASMFAASGIKAGKDMKTALRGIAGVAAMSGDSYSSIAEIFTTVAAQGVVMGQQVTQLSYHSIPALQILLDYWNKVHNTALTADEFSNDFIAKRKVDFATFAAAMDDAFGEHAKDANKTFTGALANMQTAMKRLGEKFFTPFRTGMIDVFNEGRLAINSFGDGFTVLLNKYNIFISGVTSSLAKTIKKLTNKGFFKNIAQSITSIVFAFKDIFGSIKDGFENVFGKIGVNSINKLSSKILDITNIFQTWARRQTILTTLSTGFFKVAKTLGIVIGHIIDVTKNLFDIFGSAAKAIHPLIELFGGLTNGFLNFVSSVTQALNKLNLFGKIADIVKGTTNIISATLDSILKIIVNLFGSIGNTLSQAGDQLVDVLLTVGVLKIIGGIRDLFKALTSTFKSIKQFTKKAQDLAQSINAIPESITKLLNEVRKSLKKWQKALEASTLLMIGGALLLTAVALKQLSKLNGEQIAKSLTAVAFSIGILFGALMVFEKFFSKSAGKGTGEGGLLGILDQFLNGTKEIDAYGDMMLKMAVSAFILANALKTIGELDWKQAAQGIIGLGLCIAMMVAACKLLSGDIMRPKMMKGLFGLIEMAIAMKIFASSIKDLATLSWEQLRNAILAMGVALGEILLFTIILNKGKGLDDGPMKIKSFILMAVSMKILASALQQLASIPWTKMSNAITAMAGILIEIGLFTALTSKIGKGGGVSFLLLSAGLLILANAMAQLSTIPMDSMANAITALTIVLVELVAVMAIASKVGVGALAMMLMAAALQLLVIPILALAAIPIDSLISSLVGLVGIFVIVGAAMAVFSAAFAPMILGAIALAGVSVSIGIFAAALTGLGAALTAVGAGIMSLANGILFLWKIIKSILSDIFSAIAGIINAINNFVIGVVGFFSKDAADAMRASHEQIKTGTQQIEPIIGNTIKSILKKLNLSSLFKSAGSSMINGLTSGVKGKISNVGSILISGLKTAKSKVTGFASQFFSAGGNLVKGIAKGIKNGLSSVISAVGNIASRALSAFKSKLGINSPSKEFAKLGAGIPEGIVKGIKKENRSVEKEIENVGESMLSNFSSIANEEMNPVISPVVDLTNAKNGLSAIDSMYSKTQAMDINANVNNIRNEKQQLANTIASSVKTAVSSALNDAAEKQGEVTIEVPLAIDGREFARTTATYTQSELDKLTTRTNRIAGYA